MELTINEIIDVFDYIKYVGNGEFEYKHCREGIALDEAVIIMRKYEKIEQIIDNWTRPEEIEWAIREVIDDGPTD